VPGARAALMLDSTGEVVLEAGARDERHRLVGAYQGIALSQLERSSSRHEGGAVQELWSRYAQGYVLMRPLKDGYYLVLVLGKEGSIALGRHFLRPAQAKMTQEL
jgi:predicted regulator of Ras-like GTPase activity (Roadblock/LC7/MglB family)